MLLDSTVLIDALRGKPAASKLLSLRREAAELWVSAISIEGIWRGLRSGEESVTRQFFNALRLAPLGRSEGIQAGT